MAAGRAGINRSALSRTLKSAKFTRALKPDFKRLFMNYSKKIIRQMLNEFESHHVTQEISAGPKASNISKTLSGKGNLFSFIGFESGKDPIKPLRLLLERTTVEFLAISKGTVDFKVNFPTNEQIYEVTQMPWAKGRSWVRGVEHGMSGIGQYMYGNKDFSQSRSGSAIQNKGKLRGGNFRNTSYISEIRRNFIKNLRKFSTKNLST